MKTIVTYKISPYCDQGPLERPVTGLISDLDISGSYELDACAVFKCEDRGYLVVYVSGCSCWPDRGFTREVYCATKTDVDRELMDGPYKDLRHQCQNVGWKVTRKDFFQDE